MDSEQPRCGFPMGTTPKGVNYGIFDHIVTFQSKNRVCLHCGKQLKRGQRALGIITYCPQTLPGESIPGNFFLHATCLGDLEENTISKKIDEIVQEYQTVKDFINKYGAKWGINIYRYGDD